MQRIYILSLFFLIAASAMEAQSWQWAKEANSAADELAWDLSCDTSSGVIYAGGYFKGNISAAYGASFTVTGGGADGFVAKYDPNGNVLWAFKIGGSGEDEVRTVATDVSGNVYASGYFTGTVDFDPGVASFNLTSTGMSDGFLAKYTTSGTLIWAVKFGSTAEDEAWKVTCDPAGNAYVTGQYNNSAVTFHSTSAATATTFSTAGQIDMFTCKYNPGGVVQWAISGGGSKDDIGYKVVADNSNVYITGIFSNSFDLLSTSGSTVSLLNSNSGNKSDIFVAAYSQAGSFLWSTSAGSNEDDIGMGIAQDANNLYITGSIKGVADFPYPAAVFTKACQGATDIFLACMSKSNGIFQWVSSETGSGVGEEEAKAIRMNHDGTLLVTGYFKNTLTYSPFGLSNLSANAKDVFLCNFDVSGNILWAKSAGGPGDDAGYGLANNNLNNAFVGGEHKDAAVFGTYTLTNAGAKNVFVAKYGCSPVTGNTISAAQTICSGNAPSTLTGTAPSGGSPPYSYLWKQSTDNVTWTNASGTNNTVSYSPPPLTSNMYYLRTVSSGGYCTDYSNSASILITVTPLPTSSSAGSDQAVCASSSILAANNPIIGTGTWSLLSGSGNISNANQHNSSVTALGVGTNRFIWRISNGSCPSSRDTVSIIRSINPSTASAGSNQTICSNSAFLNAINPSVGTGLWQVYSGTGVFNDPLSDNTTVNGLSTGTNSFVWTVSNGSCPSSSDTVRITVDALPTTSVAGSDQAICSSASALNGNIPAVGSGTWSVLSGSGNISNPNTFNTTVTSLGTGTNRFIWRISNGSCPSSRDTVSIIRSINPSTASAGNNQTICSSSAFLNAVNPSVGTGLWQVFTGGANISNPLSDNTTVTGLTTGSNAFVWTVSNGSCPPSTDTVIVTVDAFPSASNAGSDQAICSSSALLGANTPSTGTGIWSVLAGSGSILSPGSGVTSVNTLSTGTNSFIWTISNGVCPSTRDTVLIHVSAMPTVANAGTDQSVCELSVYLLTANLPLVGTGSWSVLNGGATLSLPAQNISTATGMTTGDNIFKWTISNGVCPSSADTVIIHVDEFPTVSNAGSDQGLCGQATSVLTANTPVVGTGQWSSLLGTALIIDPILPVTNISGISPGNSIFRWTISNGVCPSSNDTVLIHMDAQPDPAVAGPDQAICSAVSSLSAASVSTGLAVWSVIGGSGIPLNPLQENTAIMNLSAGDNMFVWTVSNGLCPLLRDTVIIHRDEMPTVANAGIDHVLCTDTILLSGNTPQTGTGNWSLLNGSCNFSDAQSGNSSVTGFPYGQDVFVWTISNGVCPPSVDTVSIQVDAKPDAANAGTDKTVCASSLVLSANTPVTGAGTWIVLTGSATTATPALAAAVVDNLDIGQTILRWKISNGVCPDTFDDIVIMRDAMPDPAIAGSDVSSDIPVVQLSANAPLTGTGTWSIVTGTAVFEDAADANTHITDLGPGKNIFKWSIHNGVCPASTDEVEITLNPLKIPNGFSPNDDGVNDFFVIPSLEYYKNTHMSIFNRWGSTVYESEDYKNDWDGKNNSSQLLSDDTYYYLLEVKPGEHYNGFIILKTGK
jgi:gliding motility-associated-like protein